MRVSDVQQSFKLALLTSCGAAAFSEVIDMQIAAAAAAACVSGLRHATVAAFGQHHYGNVRRISLAQTI